MILFKIYCALPFSRKEITFIFRGNYIAEHKALTAKLNTVKGVKAELVSLNLDDNA